MSNKQRILTKSKKSLLVLTMFEHGNFSVFLCGPRQPTRRVIGAFWAITRDASSRVECENIPFAAPVYQKTGAGFFAFDINSSVRRTSRSKGVRSSLSQDRQETVGVAAGPHQALRHASSRFGQTEETLAICVCGNVNIFHREAEKKAP